MENYFLNVKIFDWNYLHLTAQTKETYFSNKFSIYLTTYPPLNANVICEGSLSKIEKVQTVEFMFSNVGNRPTVYKIGVKTLRWRVQQKGNYLRNYYVASRH